MEYMNHVKVYFKNKHKNRDDDKKEFLKEVGDIIGHEKVQEMKKYNHHSNTSCYMHSLHVSYYNYKICKKLGWDAKAGAKAGLLHDLFLYDWHCYQPQKGERMHGFEHPNKSLKNARTYFSLTQKEGDIIAKHMFPLTITPPKYKESYVIVLTDKFCGTCEILDKIFKKRHTRHQQWKKDNRKKLQKQEASPNSMQCNGNDSIRYYNGTERKYIKIG